MRSKTKKSVSRLVGIWTFLLLFIFKGIFPKPAYAFLSSLDACAANPECAAAVSSELAPAVSAPTGAGFGTSTLSTTTAAGATTSSVQGVASVAVVTGTGISSVVAWHYWNQSQNEQAQNKAKQKYCAANSLDLVCGGQENVLYNIKATLHSTDGTYSYDYFYGGTALGSINYAEADAPSWITGYYPPLIGIYNNDGIRTGSLGWNYVGTGGYPVNESAQVTGITITSITIQDEQPETPPLSWKDWSQEKRDQAVRLLNPSDWQGLINSMPEAGRLNPGDKINAPIIVIPGEETDDPNTPADERLLRKEHGFFTFPGLPDFDKDGIPDESDPDDDNDGTPDSSDPQPYNPNIPTASGGSPPEPSPNQSGGSEGASGSQPTDDDMWGELDQYNNPTSEISPEARAIANGHAYDEHIGDFPGIVTRDEFARLIDDIMNNPSEVKPLNRRRTAYWDDTSDTVVIVDPGDADGGTAFKPTGGRDYFDSLE